MSIIAAVADVHVGNHRLKGGPITAGLNTRCRQIVDALSHSIKIANAQHAEALVILGDLFDTTRPSPQIVAAVQEVLQEFSEEVVCLVGNHDQQTYAVDDHAMAPLFPVARIVDRPEVYTLSDKSELLLVPYRPGIATEWLPEDLDGMGIKEKTPGTHRALCIHLGIYDATWRPFWSMNSHDAVSVEQLYDLAEQYEIDVVLAGNWHSRRAWKTPLDVVQVGSLAPTGWDDDGLTGHGVRLWDAKRSLHKHVEVPGPRFIKLPNERHPDYAKTLKQIQRNKEAQIYVRATADSPDDVRGTFEHVQTLHEFAGVDVRVDTTIAQAEARSASVVARSAETLDEALVGYIQAMPMSESIDRSAVLARTKDYLAGAE